MADYYDFPAYGYGLAFDPYNPTYFSPSDFWGPTAPSLESGIIGGLTGALTGKLLSDGEQEFEFTPSSTAPKDWMPGSLNLLKKDLMSVGTKSLANTAVPLFMGESFGDALTIGADPTNLLGPFSNLAMREMGVQYTSPLLSKLSMGANFFTPGAGLAINIARPFLGLGMDAIGDWTDIRPDEDIRDPLEDFYGKYGITGGLRGYAKAKDIAQSMGAGLYESSGLLSPYGMVTGTTQTPLGGIDDLIAIEPLTGKSFRVNENSNYSTGTNMPNGYGYGLSPISLADRQNLGGWKSLDVTGWSEENKSTKSITKANITKAVEHAMNSVRRTSRRGEGNGCGGGFGGGSVGGVGHGSAGFGGGRGGAGFGGKAAGADRW